MIVLLFFYIVSIHAKGWPVCSLENGRNSVYWWTQEDRETGSTVGILPIQGRSAGNKPEISLRLVSNLQYFTLNTETKEMILKKSVDREIGTTKLESIVECRSLLPDDNFKVNITVHITIQDSNDNPPIFQKTQYQVTIAEELPIGTTIFSDLQATDKDQDGPNSQISYSIVQDNLFSNLVEIKDPWTGVVSVKNRINFESLTDFSVKVKAVDQGEPQNEAFTTLKITVTDTDDLNPRFDHDTYSAFVSAGTHANTTLTVHPEPINAQDGDTLNASIVYSLSGRDSQRLGINENTGEILAFGDFGAGESFVLLVQARQTDRPERRTQANLKVTVSGENANVPRFTKKIYRVEVAETVPVGTQFLQVTAVDPDQNTLLYYSIKDSEAKSHFKIDQFSGDLILSSPLDYEKSNIFRITVQATDGLQTAEADVQILVMNSNDHVPVFDQPSYSFHPDGSSTHVGSVRAEDYDLTDQINYRLLNFNHLFSIDRLGSISIIRPPAVINGTYELVVVAEDTGVPARKSHITVKVDFSSTARKLILTSYDGDKHINLLVIVMAGILVLLAIFCTLLLICIWRLRNKHNRPVWRSGNWNRPVPHISKPAYATQPIIGRPRLTNSLENRYNDVALNLPTNGLTREREQQEIVCNGSPHGSESPLQPRSEDTVMADRQVTVSYSSSSIFTPQILQTDNMVGMTGSQFMPPKTSKNSLTPPMKSSNSETTTRTPATVYF